MAATCTHSQVWKVLLRSQEFHFLFYAPSARAQLCCKMWGGQLGVTQYEHNFYKYYRYLWNLKRKMWGYIAYYIPMSEKVGGHVPRIPHLIAPMSECKCWQHFPWPPPGTDAGGATDTPRHINKFLCKTTQKGAVNLPYTPVVSIATGCKW